MGDDGCGRVDGRAGNDLEAFVKGVFKREAEKKRMGEDD
jgi:hypothetical protein